MLQEAFKCGIHPEEFWRMTFAEYMLCLTAYYQKVNAEIERKRNDMAWHAASIINAMPYRKKAVTPKQLLGKQPKELREQYQSKDDFIASLKRGN